MSNINKRYPNDLKINKNFELSLVSYKFNQKYFLIIISSFGENYYLILSP
jgi:hypothetical protein